MMRPLCMHPNVHYSYYRYNPLGFVSERNLPLTAIPIGEFPNRRNVADCS